MRKHLFFGIILSILITRTFANTEQQTDSQQELAERVLCQPYKELLTNKENPFQSFLKVFEPLLPFLQEEEKSNFEKFKNLNPTEQRKEAISFYNDITEICTKKIEITKNDKKHQVRSSDAIQEAILTFYKEEERVIIEKRLNGKTIAPNNLFQWFVVSSKGYRPSYDTIYGYDRNNDIMILKVITSIEDGVLVQGEFFSNSMYASFFPDRFLFIKTSKKYADGDLISSGYYNYTGIKKYIGKSLHQFEFDEAMSEDIYFYYRK